MTKIMKVCLECSNDFFADTREIARGNAKCCSRSCGSIYAGRNKRKIKTPNVICAHCEIPFYKKDSAKENSKSGLFFCSSVCKTKESRTGGKCAPAHYGTAGLNINKQVVICKNCNCDFETNRKNIFCSRKCTIQNRNKIARVNRDNFLNYKADCAFKFSLKNYPNKFDFKLLEEYGWYLPSNRGNNLGGVSRDHKISIKYGFENGIDASIISHPANCELMVHSDNISKNKKCSITLEELLIDIDQWNKEEFI